MARLRIAALISGGGRTVLNINEDIQADRLDAELRVVIASRRCKGIERCRDAGMAVHLVDLKETPDVEAYSGAIAAILDEAKIDLVILAGFLSLWRIPDNYAGKVMNIHPALLPSFGGKGMYGRHVHEAVLARGCKISGCTVHFVDNEYDSGPIIVQKCVAVFDTDGPDDLADRVFEQECEAYPEAIGLYAAGKLAADGQIVRIAD